MAALAADVQGFAVGDVKTSAYSCNAADTFYRGAIVYIDTAGGCQVTCAAGDRVLGISPKNQVTTASGQEVEVIVGGVVYLPVGSGVAAADEGELLVNDGPTDTDNPADMKAAGDITLAANDAAVGTILRVTSTQMEVRIGDFTGRLVVSFATTPVVLVWQ